MIAQDHNLRVRNEGREPSGVSPWSLWGVRLAAVLDVGLVVSLGWMWVEAFYRGVAVNAQLSYDNGADSSPYPVAFHYTPQLNGSSVATISVIFRCH